MEERTVILCWKNLPRNKVQQYHRWLSNFAMYSVRSNLDFNFNNYELTAENEQRIFYHERSVVVYVQFQFIVMQTSSTSAFELPSNSRHCSLPEPHRGLFIVHDREARTSL